MADHHRRNRALRLGIVAGVLELALFVVGRLGPALANLMRIGMVIVATSFAYTIWHDARKRSGHDRRQTERRHEPTDDAGG